MGAERHLAHVHVLRGRGATPAADRSVSTSLVDLAASTDTPAVRVWSPPRQVAFGRRDRNAAGYERARSAASERGFPPVDRAVGGHAVAYTGDTLAFALARPTDELRTGIGARYDAAIEDLSGAIRACGVDTAEGEPPKAFCPGSYSLQADGTLGASGKIAGLAQRVRAEVAIVAGIVIARDADAIAAVLDPVYDALDVPFDPSSVGSVADAGGDPDRLREAIEDALVGDAPRSIRTVG